ncbi:ATP10 protein-domain-containing protein [Dendryphion nanum]|uniref:ATP10 protein-domain-containing protein n=1 Tax=Dendryphion nanum TaxID=256645 RepID=A0A9P9D899_9PLEO|nr:ATP10 protein-domain-containing protein [Dendryphion nanum]
MLQPRISSRISRTLLSSPPTYLRQHNCIRFPRFPHLRTLTTAPILRIPAQDSPPSKPAPSTQQKPPSAPDEEPTEFIPKPLGRPIGFPTAPKSGENLGIRQKKTYTGTMKEKNLEKRKDIVEAWGQNYFRDYKNIRKYRSGKTFIANPRIFKKELSLYFPNLHGETLAEATADTTDVLKGRVSVVQLYSSQWGEAQVQTFTGKKENPELHALLKEDGNEAVQIVDVNVEENVMKRWIIALFQWRLRRQRNKEDWGKYFVVRKGVSQRIRETIGALNGRVGYVYLLDEDCRIRWAGSANAEGTEMDDLTKGVRRLVQEYNDTKAGKRKGTQRPVESVNQELDTQAVNAGAS